VSTGGDVAQETAAAPEAGQGAGGEQLPPQGRAALQAWLAAGHYNAWKCEAQVMNARPRGAHGRNRICSNALLSGHGAGPYPVGAASVKEVYSGDKISIHAVAVKVKPGTGNDTWYWYEEGYADAVNAPLCIGCHSTVEQNGGRDFVFIQVK
jgi:hypothetical protein